MSELKELYQEMILDHNRQPRNFRVIEGADRKLEGFNPLCGDRLTVYLNLEGEVVKEVSFVGSGCAISKASSSLMTMSIKGKSRTEIDTLFKKFQKMVTGKIEGAKDPEMGRLVVLAGVAEFPTRIKCATLAWHTLCAALEGKEEPVSTEADDAEAMPVREKDDGK